MSKTVHWGSDSHHRVSVSHHGGSDSTVLYESHDKTVTEQNEHNEASSSDVVQQYADSRKRFSNYLSQLRFKSKGIEFANDFIYKYYANIIKDNEKESKVLPT